MRQRTTFSTAREGPMMYLFSPACLEWKYFMNHLTDLNEALRKSSLNVRLYQIVVPAVCISQVRGVVNGQIFSLTDSTNTKTISEGIDQRGSAVVYRPFPGSSSDVYYWVLPESFRGDKVRENIHIKSRKRDRPQHVPWRQKPFWILPWSLGTSQSQQDEMPFHCWEEILFLSFLPSGDGVRRRAALHGELWAVSALAGDRRAPRCGSPRQQHLPGALLSDKAPPTAAADSHCDLQRGALHLSPKARRLTVRCCALQSLLCLLLGGMAACRRPSVHSWAPADGPGWRCRLHD